MRGADHAAPESVGWKGEAVKLAFGGDGGNSYPIDERLAETEQRIVDRNELTGWSGN